MRVEDQDLKKTLLREERRQAGAEELSPLLPQVEKVLHQRGSNWKGGLSKRALLQMSPEQRLSFKRSTETWFPAQEPPPHTPGTLASRRFWQLGPPGSSAVQSVSGTGAYPSSTLRPTLDTCWWGAQREGAVARLLPPNLICSLSSPVPVHGQAGFPQGPCTHCHTMGFLTVTPTPRRTEHFSHSHQPPNTQTCFTTKREAT